MKISSLLENLVFYYDFISRGSGYSSNLKRLVNQNSSINLVLNKKEDNKTLKFNLSDKNIHTLNTLHYSLKGVSKPLFFDNAALSSLFSKIVKEYNNYEKKIEELKKEKEELKKEINKLKNYV